MRRECPGAFFVPLRFSTVKTCSCGKPPKNSRTARDFSRAVLLFEKEDWKKSLGESAEKERSGGYRVCFEPAFRSGAGWLQWQLPEHPAQPPEQPQQPPLPPKCFFVARTASTSSTATIRITIRSANVIRKTLFPPRRVRLIFESAFSASPPGGTGPWPQNTAPEKRPAHRTWKRTAHPWFTRRPPPNAGRRPGLPCRGPDGTAKTGLPPAPPGR